MKQKANKSARILEKVKAKAIEQTGTTVLVFFLNMYKTSLSI